MTKKCLYCYKPLEEDLAGFHSSCSKKIFNLSTPPELAYTTSQMQSLAEDLIRSQMTVAGVQPKLSLELSRKRGEPKRLTLSILSGDYILKPQTKHYPQLPELEDLTMHLAQLAGLSVVPHSLIQLRDKSLAYITKRIDRHSRNKIHMEDMCQLSERLTEDKYHGSYEQIAKIINRFSNNPGLDLVTFAELLVFCFITGNADMHLKNFSLIKDPEQGYILSPAYDLVATNIVNPADQEDTALSLNGKKKNLKLKDFSTAFNSFGLSAKQQENIFEKIIAAKNTWLKFIELSFISCDYKERYRELIKSRVLRLNG